MPVPFLSLCIPEREREVGRSWNRGECLPCKAWLSSWESWQTPTTCGLGSGVSAGKPFGFYSDLVLLYRQRAQYMGQYE